MDESDDIEWIYESPDNGNTIYRRKIKTNERELFRRYENNLFTYSDFNEIKQLAETNAALKKALDHLLLLYYTIKDDKTSP
jgi:hypothetical protein